MLQIHGYVEIHQLGEWYGVIDAGSLLIPNSNLSRLLLRRSELRGGESFRET